MDTCRRLHLTDAEMSQIFRRLVFNVLVNNTDDHNKNFSFLLEKKGKWRLAPAYDLSFIFNLTANGHETFRCMSLYGKTEGITKEELLEFARENSIGNASAIIADVAKAAAKFPKLAEKYKIPDHWKHIILKTLHQNLADFGFAESTAPDSEIIDSSDGYFGESQSRSIPRDTTIYPPLSTANRQKELSIPNPNRSLSFRNMNWGSFQHMKPSD